MSETLVAVMAQRFGAGMPDVQATPTDPRYRYLRVQMPGREPAVLVLGNLDPHPQGDIEVWYSASREVIQTQNGRIVRTAGLDTDWTRVTFATPPPAWLQVPAAGALVQRQHDEMPGYRFSLSDQVQITPWQGLPPVALPASLPLVQARSYQWFRESAQSVPAAWFAWGRHKGVATVVYSEQCLSPTLCLTLQRWPVLEDLP